MSLIIITYKYLFSNITLYFDVKFPHIKLAQKSSQHNIKLYASPWAIPSWILDKYKTDAPKAYNTWANYFVKYVNSILIAISLFYINIIIYLFDSDFSRLTNKMELNSGD